MDPLLFLKKQKKVGSVRIAEAQFTFLYLEIGLSV